MTNPSDSVQIQASFMESVTSKSFHRSGQQIFESIYSSKPAIWSSEILHSFLQLPLAADQATIDAWIIANPSYLQKYENYVLTADPISNNELYYIEDAGQWIKPFILEYMVADPATNQPSNGYVMQLKQGVGGSVPGQQISPTLGRWWVSPFEGAVHFETGYTPPDMGWGDITLTVYTWIGSTVQEAIGVQNVDGGFSNSVYLASQVLDGGSA